MSSIDFGPGRGLPTRHVLERALAVSLLFASAALILGVVVS